MAWSLAGGDVASDGEPLAALRPSALDDVSAIWGAHSSKEAVCSFPLASVGLIGSFHDRSLSSTGA